MDNNITARVQELVADFKLEKALELLIAQAQSQNQRKQNALLVLKGKLALLEEQNLAGILDHNEVARQKAAIAHQILDIADGSSLDEELPKVQNSGQNAVDTTADNRKRMIIIVASFALVILAYFLIQKTDDSLKDNESAIENNQEQSEQIPNEEDKPSTNNPSDGPLKVLNFPKLKQPFNFLDFGLEFAWAEAEWYSDTEIRLKIRYYMTCKSNLGVCNRPTLRIYADGKPISRLEQTNTSIAIDNKSTATDDVSFVLPATAKDFHIEFSRDHST
ncbi:MAG: hypothetical protein IPN33_16140 [Saprospiraceae bacterium]|nr:hypothetical protein [Saprospiraceae bacterium]